ncbi:MAG: GerMN domain-containing protein [Patescibacteria group bacterium]
MENEQQQKKRRGWLLILIILALLLAAAASIILIMRGREDTWLCQDGRWVKHGNPSRPMPTEQCILEKFPIEVEVRVFTPELDAEISSPVAVTGEALGNWYFEGSFPIELVDQDNNTLASGIAQAQSDWMTSEFVPFKASLTFAAGQATKGRLIFRNDNPSGLPENQKQYIWPIKFAPKQTDKSQPTAEKMTVKVYFSNTNLDPEVTCEKVFPVERTIEKTLAVGQAAIEELLKGPNDVEKADRYQTSINSGVKLNSIRIVNGTAYVDFSSQIENQVGGSCRVSLIRKQIEQTLKQFSSVKDVVISVDGRTEDILQP